MNTKISVSELGGVIDEQLSVYSKNVIVGIQKVARTSMNELVKTTKATAPVGHRSKHYRDSITAKSKITNRSATYTWYVKGSDYRLSHLLEKGHALRDGGRTHGTHFIQKATDPILEKYLKAVEEVIENG